MDYESNRRTPRGIIEFFEKQGVFFASRTDVRASWIEMSMWIMRQRV